VNVTEREKIELLLSHPEIVEWLELTQTEIRAWLEPNENADHRNEG
jgi:hypothetical protein